MAQDEKQTQDNVQAKEKKLRKAVNSRESELRGEKPNMPDAELLAKGDGRIDSQGVFHADAGDDIAKAVNLDPMAGTQAAIGKIETARRDEREIKVSNDATVEAASIDLELKRMELEMKKLQFEDLRNRVGSEQIRREQIARAQAAQQRALDEFNANVIRQQSWCKHRKGGKNIGGILNGHDSNYSIIKHTYAWGEMEIICSRCGKSWTSGFALPNGEVRKYRSAEFDEVVNWPTDNEPSGTQLFGYSLTKSAAPVAPVAPVAPAHA